MHFWVYGRIEGRLPQRERQRQRPTCAYKAKPMHVAVMDAWHGREHGLIRP